jgi:hypothetical protein
VPQIGDRTPELTFSAEPEREEDKLLLRNLNLPLCEEDEPK